MRQFASALRQHQVSVTHLDAAPAGTRPASCLPADPGGVEHSGRVFTASPCARQEQGRRTGLRKGPTHARSQPGLPGVLYPSRRPVPGLKSKRSRNALPVALAAGCLSFPPRV